MVSVAPGTQPGEVLYLIDTPILMLATHIASAQIGAIGEGGMSNTQG